MLGVQWVVKKLGRGRNTSVGGIERESGLRGTLLEKARQTGFLYLVSRCSHNVIGGKIYLLFFIEKESGRRGIVL